MEISVFRDNELITGISMLAVLRFTKKLELSKCMLIEPLLSYSKVLKLLKRANSSVKSIEDLIIKESIIVSKFSSRYQEKLILSINSLLLFKEMGLLQIEDNIVIYNGNSFDFAEQSLGERTRNRISASRRLAEILTKGDASDFYLSLRIEL